MSNSEVYRGVNKYINFNTGEEMLEYGRVYNTRGPATAYGTRIRSIRKQFRSERSTRLEDFDFIAKWTERAKEWEPV